MIDVREATETDNDELIELNRLTPMAGVISLRIDREPDFFRLTRLRGESIVLVAVAEQRIVGCVTASVRSVYIDGTAHRVAYVADLRAHPALAGRGVPRRLLQALLEYRDSFDVDLCSCVVAAGNTRVLEVLERVDGVAPFTPLGRFFVYSILPSPVRPSRNPYVLATPAREQLFELCHLVDGFNTGYQLAPVIAEQDLRASEGSSALRTLAAFSNGTIQASISVFDAQFAKSNVVVEVPPPLRVVAGILRLGGAVVPMIPPPQVGEPLRMLYLRHVAFRPGHREALRHLLQRARNWAFTERYSLVTGGFHERDPLRSMVRGLPRFTFVSHGFVMSPRHRHDLVTKVVAGIPMEDFALV